MEYILDFSNITTKDDIHEYISKILSFPDYYGRNLDALYDCLTDMPECSIILTGIDALYDMGDYGMKIIKVFKDASGDNADIRLCIEDLD